MKKEPEVLEGKTAVKTELEVPEEPKPVTATKMTTSSLLYHDHYETTDSLLYHDHYETTNSLLYLEVSHAGLVEHH